MSERPGHPSAHSPTPTSNRPPTLAEQGPYSATYPSEADLPYDVVCYGPGIATEADLRLIGDVSGKRVLDLGCGAGHAAVAMARQGAHVVAVDPWAENLERVRQAAERHELKVETHQSDLADLAFLRADSVDTVYSAYALATVPDFGRAVRQAHRVLRTDQHLVFSIPHPAFALVDPASTDPLRIRRSYWDPTPRPWNVGNRQGADHPHTIEQIFTDLSRTGLRVDTILEPEPSEDARRSEFYTEAMAWVPASLVIRARKEGI